MHTELSQLKLGMMETLQLKNFAEDYPVELWSLLAVNKKEKKLTAADIQDLLMAVYSPSGSNLREEEERVIMFFYNFLQACEGMFITVIYIIQHTFTCMYVQMTQNLLECH